MTKAGDRLIAAMTQAVEIMEGRADPSTYRVHNFDPIDVKAIRAKSGLSQAKFALRYGFPLETLKKWEQKTRRPNGAALVLLRVIDRSPEAVEAALEAAE
jgi:putative transcriptional regulator